MAKEWLKQHYRTDEALRMRYRFGEKDPGFWQDALRLTAFGRHLLYSAEVRVPFGIYAGQGKTLREKEILSLRLSGLSNGSIGNLLGISTNTVKRHLSEVDQHSSRQGAAKNDSAPELPPRLRQAALPGHRWLNAGLRYGLSPHEAP
jgi:DNA-binding CsgD family transcriptional regulator